MEYSLGLSPSPLLTSFTDSTYRTHTPKKGDEMRRRLTHNSTKPCLVRCTFLTSFRHEYVTISAEDKVIRLWVNSRRRNARTPQVAVAFGLTKTKARTFMVQKLNNLVSFDSITYVVGYYLPQNPFSCGVHGSRLTPQSGRSFVLTRAVVSGRLICLSNDVWESRILPLAACIKYRLR